MSSAPDRRLPDLPLAGVSAEDHLWSGRHTRLLRGRRSQDGQPVLLKVPVSAEARETGAARIRNAAEILHLLDVEGVPDLLEEQDIQGLPGLVLTDPGGVPLDRWLLETGTPGLASSEWVQVLLELARVVSAIHGAGVIHKNLWPGAVLWEAREGRAALTGFGLASRMPRERQEAVPLGALEGDLTYMAPEQTGRMSRGVDARSDLYALGCIGFELLAGRPPFPASDPLELVHSHLARVPEFPDEAAQGAPSTIRRILQKLLAKDPGRRYQTARSLVADLERLQAQIRSGGEVRGFVLDRGGQVSLDLEDQVHGREREVERLLAALASAADGPPHVAFVHGPSGIGKTALVEEIRGRAVQEGGYFVSGKFEQYELDVPFRGLGRALMSLARWLVQLPAEEFRAVSGQIQRGLGREAGALLEVEPGLGRVLGTVPALAPLPPVEAQLRQQRALRSFIRALTGPRRTLTLFLDDLQWSDGDSVRMLEALARDRSLRGLLVILAARPGEIPEEHPLRGVLAGLEEAGSPVLDLPVPALSVEAVESILADRLAGSPGTGSLAVLLHDHTGGNPLHLRAALARLEDSGVQEVWRDGGGELDPARVGRILRGEDADDQIVRQLESLDPATRNVLACAAVLGSRFTLPDLAELSGSDPGTVTDHLRQAVGAGLVDPVRGLGGRNGEAFVFRHDRLQRAAYRLLSDQRVPELHRQIGLAMLDRTSPDDLDDRVLTVVGHLNLARGLARSVEEGRAWAALNARAAGRAHRTGAYETTARCARAGLQLLGPERWSEDPDLTLELTTRLAEAHALRGDLAALEEAVGSVVAHSPPGIRRIRAQKALVLGYAIQGRFPDAIAACAEGLSWLGVEMPNPPSEVQVGAAFAAAAAAVGDRDPLELADLPSLEDPEELAVFDLYSTLIAVAYIASPTLFSWMILTAVERSARQGNPPDAPFFYACMGMIVMAVTGDVEQTSRYAELGMALAERTESPGVRGRTFFLVGSALSHWTEPLETGAELLVRSRELLLDAGNLEFAGYASYNIGQNLLLAGAGLDRMAGLLTEHVEELDRLHLTTARRWTGVLLQLVHTLAGPYRTSGLELDGPAFDASAELPAMAEGEDHTALAIYRINALLLALLEGRPDRARVHAEEAHRWHHGLASFPAGVAFCYLEACALLHPEAGESPDEGAGARVEGCLDTLKRLAAANPHVCEARLKTVLGLVAARRGDGARALGFLGEAMASAQASGASIEEGLAAEFAARVAEGEGEGEAARSHWRSAEEAYRRWGARAAAERVASRIGAGTGEGTDGGGEGPVDVAGDLDLRSLLKVSQILGGELSIEELPDKLLDVVVENAGATSGALVFHRHGRWLVRVRGLGGDGDDGPAVPLDQVPNVPTGVVNEALNGGNPVLVEDARTDPVLSGDPQLTSRDVRSIVCLPVQYGGRTLGALYLENHLVSGAFSEERVDTLRILCAQAAVSLQNALLFSDLKESEARLRAIVDNSIDIISMLDAEGRFRFVSPAMEVLLGYSPEEVLGQASLDYVHPDDLGPTSEALARLVTHPGGEERVLVRYRHKNGTWRHIEVVAKNHLDRPGVEGIVLNTRDVTDRLEAEERLRRSQRLEAVGQLTGGVAHDFNNLLTVITGNLEMMGELLAEDSDVQGMARQAMRAADRGATLTRSLLAFARRQSLQPSSLDVNHLLDDLGPLLRRAAPENVSVELVPGDQVPPCRADAGQLQNAILNLVVNARDAMPDGGSLTVRSGTRRLNATSARAEGLEPGLYVVISVEDTGSGMPPEVAARVFEPFFTTKGEGQGTGLGLSMVYGFALQSGGTVAIDTEVGRGTTVHLLLPEAAEGVAPASPEVHPRPSGGGWTILVVEDDDAVRAMVEAMLRSLDYRVLAAASADEAEGTLAEHPEIDLMLSDVVLAGGRNGPELASHVRLTRPDLKVVFMSGYAEDAFARSQAEVGRVPLLEKPFTKASLADTVRRTLEEDGEP